MKVLIELDGAFNLDWNTSRYCSKFTSNITIADRHGVLLSCLSAAIRQKHSAQLIDKPSVVVYV